MGDTPSQTAPQQRLSFSSQGRPESIARAQRRPLASLTGDRASQAQVSRTKVAQRSSSAALGLGDLSDDVLDKILRLTLVPPGIVASRAALNARRARLVRPSCAPSSSRLTELEQSRAMTAVWQDTLKYASADVPAAVVALPLWCRSHRADELYDAIGGLPVLMVSKRFRDIVQRAEMVRVAMCGIGDRPPACVKVLVMVWDWSDECAADEEHLKRLAALPELVALLVVRAGKQAIPGDASPCPLPAPLTSLRHLVFMHRLDSVFKCSVALMDSVAACRSLQTVKLPRDWRYLYDRAAEQDSAHRMIDALPDLVSLSADDALSARALHASSASVLRCLDTGNGYGLQLGQVLALMHFTSLRDLRLDFRRAYRVYSEILHLTQLTGLTRVEFLSRSASAWTTQLCQWAAAAPALVSLHLPTGYCGLDLDWPAVETAALGRLTSLTLRPDILLGDRVLHNLTALVGLERLDLRTYRTRPGQQLRNLSCLLHLTALSIERYACGLDGLRALSHLHRLRELRLSGPTLATSAEHLTCFRALSSLEALTIDHCVGLDDVGIHTLLASVSSRLRLLDLRACGRLQASSRPMTYKESCASADCLVRLQDLEYVNLGPCLIAQWHVHRLQELPRLRHLGLTFGGSVRDGADLAQLLDLVKSSSLRCVELRDAGLTPKALSRLRATANFVLGVF